MMSVVVLVAALVVDATNFITASESSHQAFKTATLLKTLSVNSLISGEVGVGKKSLARYILPDATVIEASDFDEILSTLEIVSAKNTVTRKVKRLCFRLLHADARSLHFPINTQHFRLMLVFPYAKLHVKEPVFAPFGATTGRPYRLDEMRRVTQTNRILLLKQAIRLGLRE